MFQCLRKLYGVPYCIGVCERWPVPQSPVVTQQRTTTDVATHDIEISVNFAVIKYLCNIWMIKETDVLHLAEELSASRISQGGPGMDQFESDLAEKDRIFRFIAFA